MPITISGSTGIAGVDGSAATPAVQGTDTNTGIYFGADAIYFTEGGVQCAAFDSSSNFQFNSGYGSVATAYGCRAWVNFNGTGTVAIRASGNVSSITDLGVGQYQVNFTSSMPDVNYATLVDMTPSVSNAGSDTFPIVYGTGSVQVRHFEANVQRDSDIVNVVIFR